MGLASNPADVDLTIEEAPAPVTALADRARILVVVLLIAAGATMLARRSRRDAPS